MPLTQLLDQNITSINITGGRLYSTAQSESYNINNLIMNSTNTIITKTLSGLEFNVQTEYTNTEIATLDVIPLFINQLSLEFIRPTSNN